MADLPDFDDVVTELFDRQPETDMVPSLDRVARVMHLLGDPQRSPRIVHITGTNGKTSTARMVEALVRSSGLRVGTFTSPHLESVTERIRVDGEPISEDDFVSVYEQMRPIVALVDEELQAQGFPVLVFFEVLTCMAYAAFADAPVDVAVVEVGLGGWWDATNVADADVAVIAPIALDHEEWLGTSPERIAREKAGIVKAGSIAVIGRQEHDVMSILLGRCADVGATARVVGVQVDLERRAVAVGGQVLTIRGVEGTYTDVFLTLLGPHQAENAVLAVAAAEALLVDGAPLDSALVDALGSVTSPGRLEAVSREPTVLLDAAHNPAGAQALAAALADSYNFDAVTAVVAIMADKDVAGILQALRPAVERVIATQAASPRALPAAELGELAAEVWSDAAVSVIPDLQLALEAARRWAADREGAAVLVTGSVVTAGQARAILKPGG